MKCRDYKALCEEVIYRVSPAGQTVRSSEFIMRYPRERLRSTDRAPTAARGRGGLGYVVEDVVAATAQEASQFNYRIIGSSY
jgi:hypothetical protein